MSKSKRSEDLYNVTHLFQGYSGSNFAYHSHREDGYGYWLWFMAIVLRSFTCSPSQ